MMDDLSTLSVLTRRIALTEQRLGLLEDRVALLEHVKPVDRTVAAPATEPEPSWKPVLHRDPPCQKVAFYLTRTFRPNEQADLSAMRVGADLHVPEPGEESTCRACHRPINPLSSRDMDFSQVIGDPIPGKIDPPPASPIDPTGRLTTMLDAMERARNAGLLP